MLQKVLHCDRVIPITKAVSGGRLGVVLIGGPYQRIG